MDTHTRYLKDKTFYSMLAVTAFAEANDVAREDAVRYLVQYGALAFLDDFYSVEHTLSFADCIADLTAVCSNNGGTWSSPNNISSPKTRTEDEKVFNLLIEFLTADMTRFLMLDNEGMSMADAVLLPHNSEWYAKAINPDSGLYYQSARYNYHLLKHELKYGSIR